MVSWVEILMEAGRVYQLCNFAKSVEPHTLSSDQFAKILAVEAISVRFGPLTVVCGV
jgi:hypothetical protein